MVVVPTVATDVAAFEEPLQLVQDLHAPRSLNHGEARLDLPAETTRAIPEDRHAEASFAVDEADDPLLETWPFLLIVRTGRIVTGHRHTVLTGCDNEPGNAGYSGFPAFSQLHFSGSLLEGAVPGARPGCRYLRTVIVTAAVYRGLGSELRPCGLTLPRNLPAPGRRHSVYIVLRLRTLLCF